MTLRADGGGVSLAAANTWTGVQTFSNHVLFSADNTYDIGSSGATRPRHGYFGGTLETAGGFRTGAGNIFEWSARSIIGSDGDGLVRLSNNTQSDFGRLMFGGQTSSFPALKRSAAALETKLADDSAYTQHNAQMFAVVDGITAPSATIGLAKIFVDTADGDLKIIYGDGTTKTIVVDT
jgi:hypothetical protein